MGEVGEDGGVVQVAQEQVFGYLAPVWRGEVGDDGGVVQVAQEQVWLPGTSVEG